jgi:hypothetical protein
MIPDLGIIHRVLDVRIDLKGTVLHHGDHHIQPRVLVRVGPAREKVGIAKHQRQG